MENTAEKNATLLNDLIEINNDRIEGYTKAIELVDATTDADIIALFERFRQQSQQFKTELTPLVIKEGEQPTDNTRLTGKLYRLWMDVKVNIEGHDRKSILASCEKGEDVFKKVYEDVIQDIDVIDERILAVIQSQAKVQLQAHNEIKSLRDKA
ncbi:ferritin-like domain-containing protein [Sphingobacterium suaedae]|uniref:PA2169 family four-helix-bundle protein n=1 Tax=Sphingobacterium suaedae TaxID=1686402 RepID=A0ABW5KIA0_9SPHI